MQKLSFLFLLTFFSAFNILAAQQTAVITGNEPGWYKIAEQTVAFNTDRDEIMIVGADKFRAIQLRATDAHIHIEDMNVKYDIPGSEERVKEDIQLRTDFKKGDHSRVIYLQYPCLKLHNITFVYRTVPNQRYEKAHIEVYALK